MVRKIVRRYTAEEILAALEELGTSSSTGEIAEQCRITAGENRYPAHGNVDVDRGLKELVADGRLVSTKVPSPYPPRTGEREDPGPYGYIRRRPHAIGNRVYATPRMAAEWKLHLDNIAVQNAAMDAAVEGIREILADLHGAGERQRIKAVTSREFEPYTDIELDLPTLQALLGVLRATRAAATS